MLMQTYQDRRMEIAEYFDRTAVDAWARLTSNAPVSRIRATVRAGRERMRSTLLSWLPGDLRGMRLLDAGCGTGALAVEAAQRGAEVVAVDISPTLIEIAKQRMPQLGAVGALRFEAGDMLDTCWGSFDYVVAMDSLIHYRAADVVRCVTALAPRTSRAILLTYAPRTPALAAMHAVGRLFPRGDRAPAIEPVEGARLVRSLRDEALLSGWQGGRSQRVSSGFYTSQALEWVR